MLPTRKLKKFCQHVPKAEKRGPYLKYSPKEKAMVENYALLHETSAAISHSKDEFEGVKWTIVNDWKKVS